MQRVGKTIRFRSSLPARLNEFAILITARHWNAQYEWFAHHRLAMAGDLDPAVAKEVRNGRVPAGMRPDEQVVYDFTTELHEQHGVSDATYQRATDAFGERRVDRPDRRQRLLCASCDDGQRRLHAHAWQRQPAVAAAKK